MNVDNNEFSLFISGFRPFVCCCCKKNNEEDGMG